MTMANELGRYTHDWDEVDSGVEEPVKLWAVPLDVNPIETYAAVDWAAIDSGPWPIERSEEIAEANDANRALDMERAAHRVTAAALEEARALAREYYADLRAHLSPYTWGKHWEQDRKDYPWLFEAAREGET